MRPVPEVTDAEIAFGGNVDKNLPKWEDIPDEFKERNIKNKYVDFITQWFFIGLKQEDLQRLSTREGVNGKKALRVVNSLMASWEPKHEHKEAGCAYLLSEWFELIDKEK